MCMHVYSEVFFQSPSAASPRFADTLMETSWDTFFKFATLQDEVNSS